MTTQNELLQYFANCPINSTHSHHLKDHEFGDISLFKIISRTYVNWIMNDFLEDGEAARQKFLEKYRCNSYATWLVRAIEDIYSVGVPLSLESWDAYDEAIRQAYQSGEHHLDILKNQCGYARVILDKYDDPGSDNGHPDLFAPTLRCDAFFNGYDPALRSHDGVSAYDYIRFREKMSLTEYIAEMKGYIRQCVSSGGVIALKVGMAYERDLHFDNREKTRAVKAFLNPQATAEEVRAYQDYVMHKLLELAVELGLPVQIHTGLASLKGTNAMALCNLIEEYPSVRFDLFHGSFPWTDDILALAHNFNNVYVDLCWLPIISTTRAIAFIKEALEVTDAERILWGCDTWTSEESYGAVLAGRYCLARALGELVDEGRFDMAYAKRLGVNILYKNAKALFDL